MMVLYGIKNCDTCKKARSWLEQNGKTYRFHDYRTDGLPPELLKQFVQELGWEKLLNRSSTSWRQLSADQQADLTEEKAVKLMVAVPTLIKRPILNAGDRLLLGFRAETYQSQL